MTALTRWNPFQEMQEMQNRLSSFFDGAPVRETSPAESQAQTWAPLIDVIETADEYLIRADLPGVSHKDLSVTLENGELIIKGARSEEQLANGAEYLYSQRAAGTFLRSFELPSDADAERINAHFKDGVLTVHVAKHEKAKPRAITVKAE